MTKEVTAEMAMQAVKDLMWYAAPKVSKPDEPEKQINLKVVSAGFILNDFIKNAQK